MMRQWMVLAGMVACGDPITAKNAGRSDTGSDADDGGANPDGGPSDADGGGGADDPPTISYAQALCDPAPARMWDFVAVASDPQGIDTLNPTGFVSVYNGDTLVSEHTTELDVASQRYSASVTVGEVNVPCEDAADHTFHFLVVDEDGNNSATKIVAGEAD